MRSWPGRCRLGLPKLAGPPRGRRIVRRPYGSRDGAVALDSLEGLRRETRTDPAERSGHHGARAAPLEEVPDFLEVAGLFDGDREHQRALHRFSGMRSGRDDLDVFAFEATKNEPHAGTLGLSRILEECNDQSAHVGSLGCGEGYGHAPHEH